MKKVMVYRLLLLTLLVVPLAGAGCGTVKSVYTSVNDRLFNPLYKKATPVKDGLKKRLLILPIIDQASLGDIKTEELTDRFLKFFEEDGNFLIHRTQKTPYGNTALGSPQFGIIVDPNIAKRAEELGMNVLVTAVLNPFEVHTERWGFWPVQRKKRELEISMSINVLDITNGTLFLTKQVTRKRKLPKDGDEKTEKVADDEVLHKILPDILSEQASAVIKELKNHPWSGRVLSAGPKNIIISAGKDVGLDIGRVFDVFERGEAIRSVEGGSLFLLGEKVGEIKIIQIMEKYASAVPLSGAQFKAGQVIKIKN
ncbi:MAG: hypothetical protein ABII06_13080 [Pseudomonadota bacterium]